MPNERVDLSNGGLEKLQTWCDTVEHDRISRLRAYLSRPAISRDEAPDLIECTGHCLAEYDYVREALPALVARVKELQNAETNRKSQMKALREMLGPLDGECMGCGAAWPNMNGGIEHAKGCRVEQALSVLKGATDGQ